MCRARMVKATHKKEDFNPTLIPPHESTLRHQERVLYKKSALGVTREVLIQFEHMEVVRWITTLMPESIFPEHNYKHKQSLKYTTYPFMIVDSLANFWKSKSDTIIITVLCTKTKTNKYSQIKQQGTNQSENRDTQMSIRYKFQYYIKNEIPITKRYKKRKIILTQTKFSIIGKRVISMYAHLLYCLMNIICFLCYSVNKNVAQKEGKQSTVRAILRPYCTILKLIFEHRIFVLEFDFFASQNNNNKNNASLQPPKTNKKQQKVSVIKRRVGRIASKEIKIMSINIAGKLEEKVKQIKKFINTEDPDILCLQETHTFIEKFKSIQEWFKNGTYDILYCSESQKSKYEEVKKKEINKIEEDDTLSNFQKERLINRWQANIMLYNMKYKGGMLLFIKKNIRKEFTELAMIPNNKSISIMSDNIDERYNIFIHFIYGPSQTNEVTDFWTKTEAILNKKVDNNKHIIIGDLNLQLEKQDSNSGEKIKLLKAFRTIMKTHMLLDAYKLKNKKDKLFTYFKIQNEKEIKSRLDYTLILIDVNHIWHFSKIYTINKKISCDHKLIGITLKTQITREFINKVQELKQKKIVVKNLTDKDKVKIIEVGDKVFSTKKWKDFLLISNTDKQNNINNILKKYEKDV